MTLLTVAEVARRLAFHKDTISALIKGGRLHAIWVTSPGGRQRVHLRLEYLERLLVDPRPVECGLCEGRLPWDAPTCPRCGWRTPRAARS